MSGYVTNIERATLENENFRKVLIHRGEQPKVEMSLQPGEDIGLETHHPAQFVRISQGDARLILGGKKHELKGDHAVVIPTGTPHNVTKKPASEQLKLYTVYSLSDHRPNTWRATKAEADAAEHAAHLAG